MKIMNTQKLAEQQRNKNMKTKNTKKTKPLGILTGANFNLKKNNKKARLLAEAKGLDQ